MSGSEFTFDEEEFIRDVCAGAQAGDDLDRFLLDHWPDPEFRRNYLALQPENRVTRSLRSPFIVNEAIRVLKSEGYRIVKLDLWADVESARLGRYAIVEEL